MNDIEHLSLVLTGAMVFDGTGTPAQRVDIGILDDRIHAIGDLANVSASRRISVSGLHIAPGFIDIHTHSDISVLYHPQQMSALAMGVTTQVVGNCGLALGLAVNSSKFEFEKRWLAPHGARINWDNFGQHLLRVESSGTGTNYVPLAGHGTLRKRVMGQDNRPPDAQEMAEMESILHDAMEAGAWGLSSGLEYTPGGYAQPDELIQLCEVVRHHGGLYATHLRNEGDTLVESVEEALKVAKGAGVPLQLSHHKAEGDHNWGKTEVTLKMVEEARAAGLDVQMDQYPYNAFMTALSVQTLPWYAQSGTPEEVAARLNDPVERRRITDDMLAAHPDWADTGTDSHWRRIQIGVCRGRPELQGKTVLELASQSRKLPIDWVIDLLVETGGYVSAVNFAMGPADIERVLRYPFTSVGSDGVGARPDGTTGKDLVHPRAYGTFPRVFAEYVRKQGILTEAEAVRRMTSLPAARMGILDRGVILQGAYADLVVYDPATIGDTATFDAPHQYAHGINMVVVNGSIALNEARFNDSLTGRVLRHSTPG